MDLKDYIKKFETLKIDKSRKNTLGNAPHKPILLLSVIELIIKGEIQSNQIYLSAELIASFRDNWSLLVTTEHNQKIIHPFFYMKSGGFWRLVPNRGYEKKLSETTTISSFNAMNEMVAYAEIDQELFLLLCDSKGRQELQHCLLSTYFPETQRLYINKKLGESPYLQKIEDKVVKESAATYQLEYATLEDEEEIFVRSNVFKKVVPRIYNYTCCVSELRIETTFNLQMIDACHIVPFSISHNDTIGNGISLCPNLHRAFDKGLFSLTNDYTVIASKYFSENVNTDYGIKKFVGKQIILPSDKIFYPILSNLDWHRKNVFKG